MTSPSSHAAKMARVTIFSMAILLAMAILQVDGSRTVPCKNSCSEPITVNGILIGVNAIVDVSIDVNVKLVVKNKTGTYSCPSYVTALVCVQVSTGVELEGTYKDSSNKLITVVLGVLALV